MILLDMLIVTVRRCATTVWLLWCISSYVYWTYGDSLYGLRNRWIRCYFVIDASVLLGVSEYILLSSVSDRDITLGISGDLALVSR